MQVQGLTFVQGLVGHAVDVAALWDQPLHHHVDAGLPVGAPHASTEQEGRGARERETHTQLNRSLCIFPPVRQEEVRGGRRW